MRKDGLSTTGLRELQQDEMAYEEQCNTLGSYMKPYTPYSEIIIRAGNTTQASIGEIRTNQHIHRIYILPLNTPFNHQRVLLRIPCTLL